MVVGKRCFDSTRAASSVAATPEPSSLAPGASLVASITSLTRLSIWPEMMMTRFGSVVPRWMPSTFHTLVGCGMRRPVTTSDGSAMVMQPPHSRPIRRNSSAVQRSDAPMPRVGWFCSDKVCRVPKLTSFSMSCRSRCSLTASASAVSGAAAGGGAGLR
jgi:hypothetical protein